MKEPRKSEILLEYAPLIQTPPLSSSQLHGQACSNDGTTIDCWRKIWLDQTQANWDKHGPFHKSGLGELWGHFSTTPVIVAGSGPSLKRNAHLLRDRGKVGLVSALHNFAFMEDNEAAPDFYVTLDAGPVVIPEVFEGGKEKEEFYWERTKDRSLLAFVGSPPELLEKWRGKVYWFNCPIPDEAWTQLTAKLEFNTFVGTGGNVAGASFYIAKAIMGANPVAFVGMDLAFSLYDRDKPRFHGWDSPYDEKMGYTIRRFDVYGNSVKTWQSYANFKCWFDYVFMCVPGSYYNCTEGGIMGAYPDGNIMKCPPMDLADFLRMYRLHEEMEDQCRNPKTTVKKLLF